jgi:hypothetical protein
MPAPGAGQIYFCQSVHEWNRMCPATGKALEYRSYHRVIVRAGSGSR